MTLKDSELETKATTFAGLLCSSLLNLPMQAIWGGINAIQIIAHLPLNNINFPLNAHNFYFFLTRVVSFDVFAPTDFFDFGLTETEPYHSNYEWLGYETTNFYENIGSIIVIGIILLLRQFIQPPIFWIIKKINLCRCWRKT